MTDDTALLRRYAHDRAEEAFAEFVRRNLPLVFSAASRRLNGDTHRAADVAQLVFCAAARDAHRLSRHPTVAGWLYTTTRNIARDLNRGEVRRKLREQEVYLMQQDTSDTETPADWSSLRPVLDSAMDELSAADREAVLLRFFQDRPFVEVGSALGLSADSARKRVERAVEKLGALLQRRGVASTSTALATLLAAESAVAFPPTLAASITTAAVASGGAAVSTAVFLGLSKLQAIAAALILAGGVAGLVTQQHTISALREAAIARDQHLATFTDSSRPIAQTQTQPSAEAAAPRTTPATGEVQMAKANPPGAPATTASPPATPEQTADMHHRYDALFQQLGFTAAQQEKFIDLKLRQFQLNHDIQEAVRTQGLDGGSAGVADLRAKASASIVREFRDLLGKEGQSIYSRYELSSGLRVTYIEPMNRALAATAEPLSDLQAEQLIAAIAANQHPIRAQPSDISRTIQMDWEGVLGDAKAFLTPQQSTALRSYVFDGKKR